MSTGSKKHVSSVEVAERHPAGAMLKPSNLLLLNQETQETITDRLACVIATSTVNNESVPLESKSLCRVFV